MRRRSALPQRSCWRARAMVFKLLQSAQKRWKRIKGFRKLELVVNNVRFCNGEQIVDQPDKVAA